MRDYEMMVILSPTIEEEAVPAALERISQAIASHDGEVGEVSTEPPWGRRRLSYPIDDHKDGFYAVYRFRLDPEHTKELDRDLKLNDQVLRFLVTRPDA